MVGQEEVPPSDNCSTGRHRVSAAFLSAERIGIGGERSTSKLATGERRKNEEHVVVVRFLSSSCYGSLDYVTGVVIAVIGVVIFFSPPLLAAVIGVVTVSYTHLTLPTICSV